MRKKGEVGFGDLRGAGGAFTGTLIPARWFGFG